MYNTLESMLKVIGTINDSLINVQLAEKKFEEVANKFLNKETLSEIEKNYFYKFIGKYYPTKIGGELYPYPKYDEKLKSIYEKVANYFILHLNENTEETIKFLQYFYVAQMSKEYNIKSRICIGGSGFDKVPEAEAYHRSEQLRSGEVVSNIFYNPLSIKKACNNPNYIPQLIVNGFHELEHGIQEIAVSNEQITNAQALIWAKEHIVRKNILGEQYYKVNYYDIFYEKDACDVSNKRMVDIYKQLGVNVNLSSNYCYDVKTTHRENAESNPVIAVDLLDNLVSKYLIDNPKVLNDFPILKNIYDSNGKKKILTQIQSSLNEQCKEKIKLHPENELEINKENEKLILDICKTDNDLYFQYLCQLAASYYSNNDMDKFNETVSQINDLLKKRELSYTNYIKKLNDNIGRLERDIENILHGSFSIDDTYNYKNKKNELSATKSLLNSIIEYNPMFKEKHNEVVMKKNIKIELGKKLKHQVIDEYKMFATSTGDVIREEKSEEELYEDFRREISELLNVTSSKEEYENDVKNLTTLYRDYINVDDLSVYKSDGESRK